MEENKSPADDSLTFIVSSYTKAVPLHVKQAQTYGSTHTRTRR